jgi:hypothetical protein
VSRLPLPLALASGLLVADQAGRVFAIDAVKLERPAER